MLCERFTGLTPFGIRQLQAREVFTFMSRFGDHITREKEEKGEIIIKNGKQVLRRKAGDDWF